MMFRRTLSALLPLAVLAALSCSKTQDTAPERRIFGDPPTIQSVSQDFYRADAEVSCDFSDIVRGQIFDLGGCDPTLLNFEPQPGYGWTLGKGVGSVFTAEPGIFVTGSYGEATLKVKATDPNSTPQQSNILLVSASYIQPDSKSETSLVLFDDGAENKFMFPQALDGVGETCTFEVTWVDKDGDGTPDYPTCFCTQTSYPLDSSDTDKNNGEFTRRLAFHNPNASPYLLDCIMRNQHDTLIYAPTGTAFEFNIEAVDRQGNLSSWPQRLQLTTSEDSFSCSGDSCGCCIMQRSLDPDCAGLPGMTSPDFPGGLCCTVLGGC